MDAALARTLYPTPDGRRAQVLQRADRFVAALERRAQGTHKDPKTSVLHTLRTCSTRTSHAWSFAVAAETAGAETAGAETAGATYAFVDRTKDRAYRCAACGAACGGATAAVEYHGYLTRPLVVLCGACARALED